MYFSKLKNSKKAGGVTEVIWIVAILFIVAVCWLTLTYVMDAVQPDVVESLNNANSKASFNAYHSKFSAGLDSAFLFIFAFFWIITIILAFFVDTHPIWFGIAIFGLMIVLILAGVLSNEFIDYYGDITLTTSSLDYTYFIMSHLVEFIIGIAASVFLALFSKSYLT